MSDKNRDPDELRTLATLLAQPEGDALDALRDLLPSAPWLAEGVAELGKVPMEHWQAEHTRLFINGWPKTPCPPFESAYRQGQMSGTAVGDLDDLYQRAGLQASEVPSDYLGTMLECAAWLSERDEGADLLRELADDHLSIWVPRFACDLQDSAALVLYRALGGRIARLFQDGDD